MRIAPVKFVKMRENLLVSRETLGRMCGVSYKTVISVEEGAQSRLETVRKIVNGLGMTVEEAIASGLLVFGPLDGD